MRVSAVANDMHSDQRKRARVVSSERRPAVKQIRSRADEHCFRIFIIQQRAQRCPAIAPRIVFLLLFEPGKRWPNLNCED